MVLLPDGRQFDPLRHRAERWPLRDESVLFRPALGAWVLWERASYGGMRDPVVVTEEQALRALRSSGFDLGAVDMVDHATLVRLLAEQETGAGSIVV